MARKSAKKTPTKKKAAAKKKTAKKAKRVAKVAKKTAAKRGESSAAKPRKAVAKSSTKRKASEWIGAESNELPDWRSEVLSRMRRLIKQADPDVVEEVKWRKPSNPAGVPVWSHGGIICTGETYNDKVKLTFAKGASLADPSGLFNASLDGNVRRAIDIHEGDKIDKRAFQSLVRAAAKLNASKEKAKAKPKSKATGKDKRSTATKSENRAAAAKPKLLAGGNPQIAKGDGDAPVQAYIEAMPGWKRDVGRRLDALIVRTVPGVRKAVRWNTPFYGIEGQGWFLGFHCITKYVKVAFFRGASLSPVPPVNSKQKDVRYFHIYEDDQLDEQLVTSWISQASKLPGEHCF